jgi:hypothetical protein
VVLGGTTQLDGGDLVTVIE